MPDTRLSPTAGTTEAALVRNVIRMVGDRPYNDIHTSDPPNPATSLTVASDATARYRAGDYIDWVDDASYDIALVTAVAATTLTVSAGQLGSTAADHAANARFRKNPRFFGLDVQKAVNDALEDLYPRVYAVYEAQLTATPTTDYWYDLDATAEEVISVYQKPDSGITDLLYVEGWSQPRYVDSTLSTSKKAMRIPSLRDNDNTVFVQYLRAPAVTDLSTGAARAVEAGAAWRLLAQSEAEGVSDDSTRPSGTLQPGQRARAASYWRGVQDDLIAKEAARLGRRFAKRARNYISMTPRSTHIGATFH